MTTNNPTPKPSQRQLAERIAEELFTDGRGNEAVRLVLEGPDRKDHGGWCKQAVIDRIVKALEAEGR